VGFYHLSRCQVAPTIHLKVIHVIQGTGSSILYGFVCDQIVIELRTYYIFCPKQSWYGSMRAWQCRPFNTSILYVNSFNYDSSGRGSVGITGGCCNLSSGLCPRI